MAQFCSVHIHAKNNEKDLFITVHHGFQNFSLFGECFEQIFIIFHHGFHIYSCSLFCHFFLVSSHVIMFSKFFIILSLFLISFHHMSSCFFRHGSHHFKDVLYRKKYVVQ
jgi:hypothetical protein